MSRRNGKDVAHVGLTRQELLPNSTIRNTVTCLLGQQSNSPTRVPASRLDVIRRLSPVTSSEVSVSYVNHLTVNAANTQGFSAVTMVTVQPQKDHCTCPQQCTKSRRLLHCNHILVPARSITARYRTNQVCTSGALSNRKGSGPPWSWFTSSRRKEVSCQDTRVCEGVKIRILISQAASQLWGQWLGPLKMVQLY